MESWVKGGLSPIEAQATGGGRPGGAPCSDGTRCSLVLHLPRVGEGSRSFETRAPSSGSEDCKSRFPLRACPRGPYVPALNPSPQTLYDYHCLPQALLNPVGVVFGLTQLTDSLQHG